MSAATDKSRYVFEITSQGHEAKLSVTIPWFEGGGAWRLAPKTILGTGHGIPFWKGMKLGLFPGSTIGVGEVPLATLEVPEDGLSGVPIGTRGLITYRNSDDGTWTLIERQEGIPEATPGPGGFVPFEE